MPEVVVVEEADPFRGGARDAGVPGDGSAAVGLLDHPDGSTDQVVGDRLAGAVAHHDHLGGRVGLPEDALDGLGQEGRPSVGRDHDGELGHVHTLEVGPRGAPVTVGFP